MAKEKEIINLEDQQNVKDTSEKPEKIKIGQRIKNGATKAKEGIGQGWQRNKKKILTGVGVLTGVAVGIGYVVKHGGITIGTNGEEIDPEELEAYDSNEIQGLNDVPAADVESTDVM